MDTSHIYEGITANKVPSSIRFDVPLRNAGQATEVAYGEHVSVGTPGDIGSTYKRVRDENGVVKYYRHVDAIYCPLCNAVVAIPSHPFYRRNDGAWDHGSPPDFG